VGRDAVCALLARGSTRRSALEADAELAGAWRAGAVGVDLAPLAAGLAVLGVCAHLAAVTSCDAVSAVGVQAVGVLSARLAATGTAPSGHAHDTGGGLVAVQVSLAQTTALHIVSCALSDDTVSAGAVQTLG